jgi:hypothetical protein
MPSSSKALMDATKKRAEKLQTKSTPVDFKELLRMEPSGTTNIAWSRRGEICEGPGPPRSVALNLKAKFNGKPSRNL